MSTQLQSTICSHECVIVRTVIILLATRRKGTIQAYSVLVLEWHSVQLYQQAEAADNFVKITLFVLHEKINDKGISALHQHCIRPRSRLL